jgi:hypothetical protein
VLDKGFDVDFRKDTDFQVVEKSGSGGDNAVQVSLCRS